MGMERNGSIASNDEDSMSDWKGWTEEKKQRVRLIKSKSIGERLMDSARRAENGCLEWTGLKDNHGYGKISYKSEYWRCHRLVWVIENGPIPLGKQILHKCDNRACFSLDHLFLGDQPENMVDMARKGRGNSNLTVEQAKEAKFGSEPVGVLAKKFGVRHQIISAIRNGRSWKYLEKEAS
jgi:hypothetical protein